MELILSDETQSAKFESAPDCVLIIRGRENDDSNGRVAVRSL